MTHLLNRTKLVAALLFPLVFSGCGISDLAKGLFSALVIQSSSHPVESQPSKATLAKFFWAIPNPVLYARFLCQVSKGNTVIYPEQSCGIWNGSVATFEIPIASEGTYSFRLRALSSQGVLTEQYTYPFAADFTAPPVPTLVSTSHPVNTWKNSASFSITVTDSESGVTYCKQIDAAAETCGHTSGSFSATLSDGASHSFKVKARDVAGNDSAYYTHSPIKVDTTLPTAPAFASPTPAADLHTSLGQVQLKFTAGTDSGSGVEKHQYKLDSGGTYADGTAGTTYTIPSLGFLSEGEHTLYVKVIDNAGNSREITRRFYVDRTGPVMSALNASPHTMESNWYLQDDTQISFTATDNLTPAAEIIFYCSIDSSIPATCTSPKAYDDLTTGAHTVSVYGVDKAGNQGSPATRVVRVDKSAPSLGGLTEFLRINDCSQARAFWKPFTDSESGLASYKLKLFDDAACNNLVAEIDPGSSANYDFLPPNLAGKRYYGRVSAKDVVGNESAFTNCSEDSLPPVDATYSAGTGTSADPYIIHEQADLELLDRRACDWDNSFFMDENIALAPGAFRWRPIGHPDVPFRGVFDGNYYVISDVSITALDNADYRDDFPIGLFGRVQGEIRHLEVSGSVVGDRNGLHPTGLVAGELDGDLAKIFDVLVSPAQGSEANCTAPSAVSAKGTAGGLVGLSSGTIMASSVECTSVTKESSFSLSSGFGGLIGENTGRVIDAYSHASIVVASPGPGSIGGLIGTNNSSVTPFALRRVYASLSGSTPFGMVGALIGQQLLGAAEDSLYDTSLVANEVGLGLTTGAVGKTRAELQTPSTYPASYGLPWILPPLPPLVIPAEWPMAYFSHSANSAPPP